MIEPATLALFLLAISTLFISPGPNMAFVLSHGIAHGPRAGLAAALGIGAADAILTLATASGLTALVATWAPSFDVLRYAGAVYLIWLAFRAVMHPGSIALLEREDISLSRIAGRATVNSLLNPKALLFFMVFLPQFVDTNRADVPLQLALLGLILTVAGTVFHGVLGAFSGQVGSFIRRHPQAAKYQGWFLGAVLVGLAVRLVLLERPSPS